MKYELNFRNNSGSDQELLDDMKNAAVKLGTNNLTWREYDDIGKFSSKTISTRFGSWNNALEKAGLKITTVANISQKELLDDMKNVAAKLGMDNLIMRDYDDIGKFSSRKVSIQFGSWNNALEKAGLKITAIVKISQKELFENLEDVWVKLGRQPKHREMRQPLSKYSERGYISKYGSWRKALEAFVEFINSDNDEDVVGLAEESNIEVPDETEVVQKHKTKRQPSGRLKVEVLMRDGNKCRLCGVTVTGENIHFDHIKPWSKGGETTLENLQVLCATHNLAKGDLEYEQN